MGRPRKGSIRRRGERYLASVPRLGDPKKRREASFATESEAAHWVATQLNRLEAGLEPEASQRPGGIDPRGDASDFEQVARRWHQEHYVEMELAGAERQISVLRDMELHLFEPFAQLLRLERGEGRALVKDWLRVMSGREPLDPDSPLVRPGRTYSRETVTQLLWMLREVLAHARVLGVDVPDFLAGRSIRAMDPLGRPKRRAPLVSIAKAQRIAGGLHVIHQAVLWLLRVAGLRISEAYGLYVEDLIIDEDGSGYLLVADLGGRSFFERGEDGAPVRVHHRKGGKTAAATRVVPLPRQLTELLTLLVEVFHTDAVGRVDTTARLIPIIQSARGGQAGFRSALRKAAGESLLTDDELEAAVVAHDLRKGYATDLAWAESISDLLARRAIGHRAGNDVFSLVYTLDPRLKSHLTPVARVLEDEIDTAAGSLMAPTAVRPLFASTMSGEVIERVNARLLAAGWLIVEGATENGEPTVSVREAARILQLAESTTRRLFGGAIPAYKSSRGWRALLKDVEAFGDRNVGRWLLPDLAADLGVPYHVAFQALSRLGISPRHDSHDERVYVLSEEEAGRLRQAVEESNDLRDRALRVHEAAALLGVAESAIRHWVASGRLELAGETDYTGATYVTRESVEVEEGRRHPAPRGVSAAKLCEVAGIDRAGLAGLVKVGLLVRDRRGLLTGDSVRRWATGYRPELLSALFDWPRP